MPVAELSSEEGEVLGYVFEGFGGDNVGAVSVGAKVEELHAAVR